jgi:[acyl-carrier-protein] S-malonyltransferase
VHGAAQARQALAAQITTPVRWDECMEGTRSRRPGCVLEIGPGQAPARLWNARHPEIPARSCDEFRSAAGIAKGVAAHSGG